MLSRSSFETMDSSDAKIKSDPSTPPRDGQKSLEILSSPRSSSKKRKSSTPKKLLLIKTADTDSEDELKQKYQKTVRKILQSPKQPMILKHKLLQSLDSNKKSPKRFPCPPKPKIIPKSPQRGFKRKINSKHDFERIPQHELNLCQKRRKIARKIKKEDDGKDEVDFGLIGFSEAFMNNNNNLNLEDNFNSADDGLVSVPPVTDSDVTSPENLLLQIDSLLQGVNANGYFAEPGAPNGEYYDQTTTEPGTNNYQGLDVIPDSYQYKYNSANNDNLMCLICGILFSSLDELNAHSQQYHPPAVYDTNTYPTDQHLYSYNNEYQLPTTAGFNYTDYTGYTYQTLAPSSSTASNYEQQTQYQQQAEYLQLGFTVKKEPQSSIVYHQSETKSKTEVLNDIVKDLKSVSEMHLRNNEAAEDYLRVGEGTSINRRQRRTSSTENREINIEVSSAPATMSDIIEISGDKSFQCNLCKKTFKSKNASKRHMKVHLEHKPYNCDYCDLTFTRNDLLMKHKRTHTGERPFVCNECGKTFLRKCHLSDHLTKHSNVCEKCQTHYDQCKHMKVYLGKKDDRLVYICPICAQIVATGLRLHVHMLTHSAATKTVATETRATTTAGMACKFCNEVFGSSAALTSHYQTHRLQKNMNSKCEACLTEKNASSAAANSVDLVHTCNSQIFCKYCELPFDGKTTLQEHLKAKHGDGMFECNICKQKFSLKQNMKNHIRVHSGERPYPCNFCGQTFASQTTCKRHERSHTGERPYKCNVCHKTFGRHFVLMKHLKMHARIMGRTLDKETIKTMYEKITI